MARNERPPRRSATAGERRAAVEERRARAIEEPLDVRLRTAAVYPILEVRNPLHGTVYLVLLPEFPSIESAFCTCTDFARRGLGTCKHIEAGHRWLMDHPDATPLLPPGRVLRQRPGVWKEIDRRLAALPNDTGPESRRYRRPGQALFARPQDD
jgi:hypothetical protein